MEVWKELKGFENKYWVSNTGKVRSRSAWEGLAPRISNGYMRVALRINGKTKEHFVHKLVASTFAPCEGMEDLMVNHKDEDKTNNHIDNLEWVSSRYNVVYSMIKNLTREERIRIAEKLIDNDYHL